MIDNLESRSEDQGSRCRSLQQKAGRSLPLYQFQSQSGKLVTVGHWWVVVVVGRGCRRGHSRVQSQTGGSMIWKDPCMKKFISLIQGDKNDVCLLHVQMVIVPLFQVIWVVVCQPVRLIILEIKLRSRIYNSIKMPNP